MPHPEAGVKPPPANMPCEATRLRWKTWICIALMVLCNVSGNFFLKLGMPSELPTALAYITALFRPFAALGVVLLILWMAVRMALMSWTDLSYLQPVTAIDYVLVAIAGRLLLHEHLTTARWCGIALIVLGVALVSGGSSIQTWRRERSA